MYLIERLHLAMLLLMRELGIGKRKLVLCLVHSLHHAMCIMQLTTYRL